MLTLKLHLGVAPVVALRKVHGKMGEVMVSKWLGGGNSNIFYFHPYLGKVSILAHIFQRGWNHQPDGLSPT